MNIKCPTCQTEKEWSSDNAFRPFCCERCKLIDLGAWANESHVIPGQPTLDLVEGLGGDQLGSNENEGY